MILYLGALVSALMIILGGFIVVPLLWSLLSGGGLAALNSSMKSPGLVDSGLSIFFFGILLGVLVEIGFELRRQSKARHQP